MIPTYSTRTAFVLPATGDGSNTSSEYAKAPSPTVKKPSSATLIGMQKLDKRGWNNTQFGMFTVKPEEGEPYDVEVEIPIHWDDLRNKPSNSNVPPGENDPLSTFAQGRYHSKSNIRHRGPPAPNSPPPKLPNHDEDSESAVTAQYSSSSSSSSGEKVRTAEKSESPRKVASPDGTGSLEESAAISDEDVKEEVKKNIEMAEKIVDTVNEETGKLLDEQQLKEFKSALVKEINAETEKFNEAVKKDYPAGGFTHMGRSAMSEMVKWGVSFGVVRFFTMLVPAAVPASVVAGVFYKFAGQMADSLRPASTGSSAAEVYTAQNKHLTNAVRNSVANFMRRCAGYPTTRNEAWEQYSFLTAAKAYATKAVSDDAMYLPWMLTGWGAGAGAYAMSIPQGWAQATWSTLCGLAGGAAAGVWQQGVRTAVEPEKYSVNPREVVSALESRSDLSDQDREKLESARQLIFVKATSGHVDINKLEQMLETGINLNNLSEQESLALSQKSSRVFLETTRDANTFAALEAPPTWLQSIGANLDGRGAFADILGSMAALAPAAATTLSPTATASFLLPPLAFWFAGPWGGVAWCAKTEIALAGRLLYEATVGAVQEFRATPAARNRLADTTTTIPATHADADAELTSAVVDGEDSESGSSYISTGAGGNTPSLSSESSSSSSS